MINIRCIDDLDVKLINDILKIDSAVFPKFLQGTFVEVYGRFKANRDIFILLYSENDLIGYLCLFPVKDILYKQILNEKRLFDSDMSGELIERYEPFNTYKLYLISAAIHPEYQRKGLSKHLIDGFFQYILEKKKNNIFFSTALSTSVTVAGRVMLKKMGFKEKKTLLGGYVLHELDIVDAFSKLSKEVYGEL
jgi:GNAT superfamily N-acetyltransferase